MGIGISVFLLAVGAILWLAVNVDVGGVDINVVGIVLVVVGIIGVVWSGIVAARARGGVAERREVVEVDDRAR